MNIPIYSGIFQNIQEYYEIFRNISKYSGIFQNISKYSKIFRNTPINSGIFENTGGPLIARILGPPDNFHLRFSPPVVRNSLQCYLKAKKLQSGVFYIFGCFSMRSLTFVQRLGIENLNPDDINESLTFENEIQCEFQA